jgi:hypothetical protein
MLRAVLDQNLRRWEDCLPHVEFAYNHATHSSTKMCPFQVVYGYIPRAPIDLFSFDTEDAPHLDVVAHVEKMVNLHEQTHQNIAAANAKYQVAGSKGKKHVTFESGDMVWLHLRKDYFPTVCRSKLILMLLVVLKCQPRLMIMLISLPCLWSLVFPLVLML